MAIFVLATVVGLIVGVIYLALAARSFSRVRARVLAGAVDELGTQETYEKQEGQFAWKAGIAVIVSVAVLASLSISSIFWYLLPLLAIGTAVAVIVAFLVEENEGDAR